MAFNAYTFPKINEAPISIFYRPDGPPSGLTLVGSYVPYLLPPESLQNFIVSTAMVFPATILLENLQH